MAVLERPIGYCGLLDSILYQGKTMISQSILLELAVGDTVQLYMYTSSGITDHKNSRYTHLVGLLLR